MPGLNIPESIKENSKLSPAAKLTFGEMFSSMKKGQRTTMHPHDFGTQITLGGEELIDAVRNLHENEYAFLDETICPLEQVIPGQEIRISPRIHIEVLPHVSEHQDMIDRRRYHQEDENRPLWDSVKIGLTVYKATLSKWMGEWALSIKRLEFPPNASSYREAEEQSLVEGKEFPTERKAWDWFDEYIEGVRADL